MTRWAKERTRSIFFTTARRLVVCAVQMALFFSVRAHGEDNVLLTDEQGVKMKIRLKQDNGNLVRLTMSELIEVRWKERKQEIQYS